MAFIFCIALSSNIPRITYKANLLVKNSQLILFHNRMTEYSHSGIKNSSLALILSKGKTLKASGFVA